MGKVYEPTEWNTWTTLTKAWFRTILGWGEFIILLLAGFGD
jgi:hypothetical protein